MAAKFRLCQPDMGLCANENHICLEYLPKRRILFSMTQQGRALSCHFAADQGSLRHVKGAINDFCDWAFMAFDWCQMIFAPIKKPSVVRLVKKCGFEPVVTTNRGAIYVRYRPWAA